MATLSFRDRFYSPPVSRAVTSPSAILALGLGAAIGVVATAPLSVPLAVVGAIVGGLAGYGGRVALAIPGKGRGTPVEPNRLKEPWRRAVQEAVRSQARFEDAVSSFRRGPLHNAMEGVSGQIDDAIAECWKVAQQGDVLAEARRRINDRETRWELEQATASLGGREPNQIQASTIVALQSQLQSAQRLDALIARTRDELALLNARLDESVTKAIELSVSNRIEDAGALGRDMGEIVEDLETLRMAIEDVDASASPPPLPPPPVVAPGSTLPAPPAGGDAPRPGAQRGQGQA